jgi:type IV secretory pathway TraG/TraD family ATPase VirD4
MLYYLFTDYSAIALKPALIASGLGLFFTMLYLLLAGSSIRRSATSHTPKHLHVLRLLMIGSLSVGVGSFFVLLTHKMAIQSAPFPPDNTLPVWLSPVIGAPFQVATKPLLSFSMGLLLTLFLCNFFLMAQTTNGSPLRLWLDGFRTISRKQEEHGSSHFATPQEYRRFRNASRSGVSLYGKFFGQRIAPQQFTYLGDQFALTDEDAARGMLTIGNPGSGKSSSVILPMIYDSMQAKHNLVVADPQRELTKHILQYARTSGHRVIIHDPTHPRSPRFNLADGIRSVSDARAVADVLIPKGSGGTDSFWSQSAEMLLAACLLRFDTLGAIFASFKNLKQLGEVLNSVPDDAQRLAGAFINSTQTDAKLANNIVATLSTSLTGWADETVRDSTITSDFSGVSLINPKQPTIVILACPGKHRRVIAPYLGAVLTRLLLDLDAIGERTEDGALPVPVRFVIDEFPALGDLSAVVQFANLVRKRRIAILIAAQTLGQLEQIYGRNGTETLLAGMAFQIVFGGCDQRTAEHYSRVTGTTTQKSASSKTESAYSRGRTLLTPDEIIRPPQGNCTIFGRYVTSEFATYVIVLSRLTRIYERHDVQRAVQSATKRRARVIRRWADKVKHGAMSKSVMQSTNETHMEAEPTAFTRVIVSPLCMQSQLTQINRK